VLFWGSCLKFLGKDTAAPAFFIAGKRATSSLGLMPLSVPSKVRKIRVGLLKQTAVKFSKIHNALVEHIQNTSVCTSVHAWHLVYAYFCSSASDSASLSPTLRALQIKFTYLLTYLRMLITQWFFLILQIGSKWADMMVSEI